MNVIMILPPSISLLGLVPSVLTTGAAALAGGSGYNLFLDMQASLIDLKMHRYLVEHQIPGREGGKLQDLGSACSVITIQGKWIYENRPHKDILDIIPALAAFLAGGENMGWNWARLQMMMMIYRLREPMILASDLLTSVVLIEDFNPSYEGGKPNVYNYTMVLREVDPRMTLAGTLAIAAAKTFIPIPQEGMGF